MESSDSIQPGLDGWMGLDDRMAKTRKFSTFD